TTAAPPATAAACTADVALAAAPSPAPSRSSDPQGAGPSRPPASPSHPLLFPACAGGPGTASFSAPRSAACRHAVGGATFHSPLRRHARRGYTIATTVSGRAAERAAAAHAALPTAAEPARPLIGTDLACPSGRMPAPAPPATSSLDPDGTAKAQRLIDGLSAGGSVAMPLQPPSGPAVPHQHRPPRRRVDDQLRGRDETLSLVRARGVACTCVLDR